MKKLFLAPVTLVAALTAVLVACATKEQDDQVVVDVSDTQEVMSPAEVAAAVKVQNTVLTAEEQRKRDAWIALVEQQLKALVQILSIENGGVGIDLLTDPDNANIVGPKAFAAEIDGEITKRLQKLKTMGPAQLAGLEIPRDVAKEHLQYRIGVAQEGIINEFLNGMRQARRNALSFKSGEFNSSSFAGLNTDAKVQAAAQAFEKAADYINSTLLDAIRVDAR
jgi:hypothetical protein